MNDSVHYLFALLRKALHPERPEPMLGTLTPDWRAIYRLAAHQGVLAVAWDGMQQAATVGDIPPLAMPDRTLKIQWALAVDGIEKRYKRQRACVDRMAQALDEAHERALLFKGVSLAQFYPIPQHRECGDIDIYPMDGRFESVQQVLLQAGGQSHYDSMKHAELTLDGVMIENHRTFFSGLPTRQLREANRTLIQYAVDSAPLFGHTAVCAPQSRFDQLFVLLHGAMHFRRGEMSLRQLLDWYVVMQQCCFRPDVAMLQHHRVLRFAAATSLLCEQFLGAPAMEWCTEQATLDAPRVLHDLLELGAESPQRRSPLHIVLRKAKRFYNRRWTYAITGTNFLAAALYSVYAHLRLPRTIFNPSKR